MYENKIVNLYVKKYMVMAILWLGMAITMFGTMNKYSDVEPELTTFPDGSIGYDNSLNALSVAVIAICLFMVYYSAVKIPKSAKKQADSIGFKYLKETIAKNPQFKDYEYLLKNPKAVEGILNILSQEFSKQEIIRMVTIAKNADSADAKTKYEKVKIIKNMEKDILVLVKEHEKRDPEFINKILIQLSRASYTYPIVFQNQRTSR
jgi:hypothetical protein